MAITRNIHVDFYVLVYSLDSKPIIIDRNGNR